MQFAAEVPYIAVKRSSPVSQLRVSQRHLIRSHASGKQTPIYIAACADLTIRIVRALCGAQHSGRVAAASDNVKVYSMPAIGRRNVHATARVGRRRISPMAETAECPNAAGGFAAMAIDRPGCTVVPDAARSGGAPGGR